MEFTKYSFPNPNNGDRYDLSQDELIQLLDKVYQAGWDQARWLFDPALQPIVTTSASFEDRDDNTKWKEVWIK